MSKQTRYAKSCKIFIYAVMNFMMKNETEGGGSVGEGTYFRNKASGSRDLKQVEGPTMQISEEEQTR